MQSELTTRELFRKNYQRLETLCGELMPLHGLMRSQLPWLKEILILELVEENFSRSELLLYSREAVAETQAPPDPCPLFRVALLHERRWARVLGVQDEFGNRTVDDAEVRACERMVNGMNRQLALWLEHALISGHELHGVEGH